MTGTTITTIAGNGVTDAIGDTDVHVCADREALARAAHRGASLVIEVEDIPSANPRTGKLSYLSAIAMLRELGAPVRVG